MTLDPSPGITHPAAQQALARRTRWSLIELAIGIVLLGGGAALVAADVDAGIVPATVGFVLTLQGAFCFVASRRIGGVLASHPWRQHEGVFVRNRREGDLIDARDAATGEAVLVRVWSGNAVRNRSLPGSVPGPLWLAGPRVGWGTAAGASFAHLVLVKRYEPGSKRQRHLEGVRDRWSPAPPRQAGAPPAT